MANVTVESEKTYQMLWDCRFCGQRKNLGLTHRCCPSCGGPQDPTQRYFPSDAEKIAVEDHPYAGADVLCPNCRTAVSRNVKCCTNCGGPMQNAREVAMRSDQVGQQFAGETVKDARMAFDPQAQAMAQAAAQNGPQPKKGTSPLVFLIPVVIVVAIVALIFVFTRKRDGAFVVASKGWERTVEVEELQKDRRSTWCDALPLGVREVSRHSEQRDTKKVEDGKDCHMRRKDQGNGTFKEVKECTPKYKEVPVMADKCDYDAEAWKVARTAKANGAETAAPSWPATNLSRPGCSTLGCQREGKRAEKYEVSVSEPKTGKSATCELDAAKWAAFKVGDKLNGKAGSVTGSLDCASIGGK